MAIGPPIDTDVKESVTISWQGLQYRVIIEKSYSCSPVNILLQTNIQLSSKRESSCSKEFFIVYFIYLYFKSYPTLGFPLHNPPIASPLSYFYENAAPPKPTPQNTQAKQSPKNGQI